MTRVVTFGEVMLRLSPPGFERFFQSPSLEATFGGGEANVSVSLANYGMDTRFVTVLPNCTAPLIVQATLGFSSAILDAAALGFLGLGAQPPTPEWGTMLADSMQFVQSAWWVVTFPGLAILITVLAFNLMGDGLRDALDPKLKR